MTKFSRFLKSCEKCLDTIIVERDDTCLDTFQIRYEDTQQGITLVSCLAVIYMNLCFMTSTL